MTNYSIIAAMTQDGVIGIDNKLPWHIQEEFKHFKSLTMDKYLIMGRNTFESIGRKVLPGRKSIVITSAKKEDFKEDPNLFIVDSIPKANALVTSEKEVMVIGGANIYKQYLTLASKMYLSIVNGAYEGNVFFPNFDKTMWQKEDEQAFAKFKVETWKRDVS